LRNLFLLLTPYNFYATTVIFVDAAKAECVIV